VIRDKMNECIRDVINRLPENYRTVILLGDLEGFRDKDIAEILGFPAAISFLKKSEEI
jgi:RNA polymerase sigma-70 factor (ECF subfamily)